MSTTAKNLERSASPPKCGCSTWIRHWENNSGKQAETCSALGCSNHASVGGHVQKKGVSNNRWYIIPICKACNGQQGLEFHVKAKTVFIHVGKTEQCGSGNQSKPNNIP